MNTCDTFTACGTDEHYMSIALKLARKGRYSCHPNPAVGCVIVRDDRVAGRGWHRKAGQPHAEIHALADAGERASGATLYVTLEPCCHTGRTPPCTGSIIAAGVRRVVMACEDPDPRVSGMGMRALREAGIQVESGVCREAARSLNRGYFWRNTTGLPYVTVKIAASLDGKTAMASGESQWITSPPARLDVQRMRAESGAVMTGIGTVLADDPALTVRIEDVQRQPDRLVLDSDLRTPSDAGIFNAKGRVYLFCGKAAREDGFPGDGRDVELVRCAGHSGKLDLHEVLAFCAGRRISSVLVEAGPVLTGSLLRSGLANEVVLYLSPDLLGHDAMEMCRLPGLDHLSDRIGMEFADMARVGRDLKLIMKPSAG